MSDSAAWPELRFAGWRATYDTLHLWTQIAGKIGLALSPMKNHWWQSVFYVTSRGMTTGPVPAGFRTFDMTFDFVDHQLRIDTSDGASRTVKLAPKSVAHFYGEVMDGLRSLGIEI